MNSTKKERIAIYGLGAETEKNIYSLDIEYDVCGLLDGFREDGELYGKKIITINEAIKFGITKIIVVARPGSCRVIAKRIGSLCEQNAIELVDIRGKNLLEETKVRFCFQNLKEYSLSELMNCIKKVDVVSFDLFDTLIVRRVLSVYDVISLVEVRLKERGIIIDNFIRERIRCEKELSRLGAPTLNKIYSMLLEPQNDYEITASELAEIEFEIDLTLIQPRYEVVKLLQTIKENEKKIYITSDSYYSKTQICAILTKCGIDYIILDGLLVSCEYNTVKSEDLFCILNEISLGKKILHIGDDLFADCESANKHGIDSFKIYSSAELFENVGELGLVDENLNLSDRLRVGMMMAELFNNPFVFEDEFKNICVDDSYKIGYIFCAPIIYDFVEWFGRTVKDEDIKNIWFSARDGYLIKQLYELIWNDMYTVYYYTSRTAAIRAGIGCIEDIEYVNSMKYFGNVDECMKRRFGIDVQSLIPNEIEKIEDIKDCADVILEISKNKRKNNLKYIQKINMTDDKIVFFDFVAKGTSQLFLQKIISNQILGLYFMQLEPDIMKDKGIHIKAFYSEEERENSTIYDIYYVLETIITAPHPSVEEFDNNGEPIFAKETRTDSDIECFLNIQEGILEYARRYNECCPKSLRTINKSLDEKMLSMIRKVHILNNKFLSLMIEDPFYNRMTKITDVI